IAKTFAAKFGSKLESLCGKDGSRLADISNKDFNSQILKFCRSEILGKDIIPRKSGDADLLKSYSPWLQAFHASDFNEAIDIPGQYTGAVPPSNPATIVRFDPRVLVMSSIRKPKRVSILGSDEKEHLFLVKGGEDLRLDQRIQQLFSLMNDIMAKDSQCARQNITIGTYKVVPMSGSLGILEWVDNTKPLRHCIEGEVTTKDLWRKTQEKYSKFVASFKGDMMGYHNLFINGTREAVVRKMDELYADLREPYLRYAIARLASSPEAFLKLRSEFAKSLAAINVCSYILGIGDRHLENFLLDMSNGCLIPIDFGHAFGSATEVLPVPELAPFRLTRQLELFLSPLGSKGLLEHPMVCIMRALQDKKEVILNTMDVFVKEPLLDWRKFAMNQAKELKKQGADMESFEIDEESTAPPHWYLKQKMDIARLKLERGNPSHLTVKELAMGHANKPYLAALSKIAKGTPASARAQHGERCSTVQGQVACLLDMATDKDVLGRASQAAASAATSTTAASASATANSGKAPNTSPVPTPSSGPLITPPSLGHFCIYNTEFGPTDETQHEQLLCYIARKTVSMDAKMRNIGLAQGLVNFARIFSPDAPCDNVHSQKNRLVFYEPEPNYWMHLCIELGTIKRSVKGSDGKYKVITEYQEHQIHDMAASALLRQAYGMYRVAHGSFDSLVTAHDGNTRPLQRRLEEFFESWVFGWDFEKAMTLERALDGVNYLPLTRPSYPATDRLIRTVREKYPFLTHSMVTFEDQLVSTDIRDCDLRTVWKQIVQLTGYDSASLLAAAEERRDEEEARKRKTTFKFGKSWSNTSIFGFYRSSSSASTPPSTPPLRPGSRVGSPAPSIRSVDIGYNTNSNNTLGNSTSGSLVAALSGLTGSSPRPSGEAADSGQYSGGKSQVNALWFGQQITSEDVDEFYGIVYKHKSGLNLSFFAPIQDQRAQDLLEDMEQFNQDFEDYLSSLVCDASSSTSTSASSRNTPIESVGTIENGVSTASRSLVESVSKQIVKDAVTARGLGGLVSNDKEIRFLYFNKMNLAIKAQLNSTTGKGGINMGSDMALSLLDIKSDFDRMPDATEITTRSPSNHWIVGKRFEDREVYMIVSRKDSTLVEVEDEVRKLTSLYFNSISLSSPGQSTPGSLSPSSVQPTPSISTVTGSSQ
ncbi:hypothetical protein BGZ94_010081, partial [Podila epigama]